MAKVLLVEDDTTFSMIIENFLKKRDFQPTVKSSVSSALKELENHQFDILLLDYRLPDGTGLDIIKTLPQPLLPTIIMTSLNDVRTAVKAMQLGIRDYITKPVNPDELELLLKNCIKEPLALKKKEKYTKTSSNPSFIRGISIQSKRLHDYIALVAPTDMTVIIQGESGTGKEYVASSIHQASARNSKPFIAIDCGALSKELAASELFGHIKGAFTGALMDKIGQFEQANGGTLFLDEVGNLSYEVQVQLLRAIQEREIQPVGSNKKIKVDVRIITATNDDLTDSVLGGSFREDLYHRLNEFKIQVPPLRERADDLFIFIDHFITEANADLNRNVKKLSGDVRKFFANYEWPGNLRELKNIVRRMVLLTPGDTAEMLSLPDEMIREQAQPSRPSSTDLKSITEANERDLIKQTLEKVKYNKSKAAKMLNIDRTTLYNKIEKYNLD